MSTNTSAAARRLTGGRLFPLTGLSYLLLLLFALCGCISATRVDASDEIIFQRLQFTDNTRATSPAFNFPGSESRRLDVLVWRPLHAPSRRLPLIIYSHGNYGRPDNARYLIEYLVNHGYMVAAPVYPLTSRASYANIPNSYVPDVINQPIDIKFIIDRLLAHETLGPLIDANAIGSSGHSMGGVTTYFASFVAQTRDPRIAANAVIAGGDPILAYNMIYGRSIEDAASSGGQTPVLFLSADKDVMGSMKQAGVQVGGKPFAAYARRRAPKYELQIHGGTHTFFVDADSKDVRADGRNPDCTAFQSILDRIPECATPTVVMTYERQHEITRDALLTFFDAYLKHDAEALARLRSLGEVYPETELKAEP